jgi:hypothetical protein
MFDIFYYGPKPNLFAHERAADSIDHARKLSQTRYFWWVNYLTDYTNFDFLYEPAPWQSQYIHAWPSRWDQFYGACLVPTNVDNPGYHYHTEQLPPQTHKENFKTLIACNFDYSWVPHPFDPPYIYVFGNQWWSAIKQPTVEYHTPGATERKYILYPRAELSVNMDNWKVPTNVDVSTFDFSWQPDPGDPPYIYQFGTQHQRTGGPQYCVSGATDVKYVDQIKIKTGCVATAIYEIDHMDRNAGQISGTTKTVRYFDNYLDTLKRIAKNCNEEFIWICSSICDYSNFDFTWHPEQWQATMLHVFPSDGEKFGDTFFMHIPTFKYRSEKLQLLDWYDLNFMDINVPRRALPVIQHSYDTHVEAVKSIEFVGPLAVYTTNGAQVIPPPAVPLWRKKTKTIVPLSPGASTVIVPKVAVPYIKTQLYDYSNIDRSQRHMLEDEPLDIVFIDNGEPNAEENWKVLEWAYKHPRTNRLHRSSGVNGRVAAYQAAAKLSTTPWFFAVFAKLHIDNNFDWAWQPDRLQEPKHYIFHAYNPVNGLTYGHQAMIAYNKELVLNNPGTGLDFTLDSPHEVVPILSGIAHYNDTPWMTWRTAFREVLKLQASLPDVENEYRIKKWRENTSSKNSIWSVRGASDAIEYYTSVGGELTELRKSYDWEWLATYAMIKHNLLPNQRYTQLQGQ